MPVTLLENIQRPCACVTPPMLSLSRFLYPCLCVSASHTFTYLLNEYLMILVLGGKSLDTFGFRRMGSDHPLPRIRAILSLVLHAHSLMQAAVTKTGLCVLLND